MGIDADYAAQLAGLNFGAGAVGYAVETTNPNGEKSVAVYDCVGRMVRTIDGNKNVTLTSYTIANRTMGFYFGTFAIPLLDTTVADAVGNATQTFAAALGRTMFTVDAAGNQSSYQYDPNGNLTEFRDANNTGYR